MTDVPEEVRPLMVDMTKLVGPNLLAECGGNITEMPDTPVVFHISVHSPSLTLDWNTDEEYSLDVQYKGEFIIRISFQKLLKFCDLIVVQLPQVLTQQSKKILISISLWQI